MRIVSPAPQSCFSIGSDTTPPSILVTTDADGPLAWTWRIDWLTFKKSGHIDSVESHLDFAPIIANLGGRLYIEARKITNAAAAPRGPAAPQSAARAPLPKSANALGSVTIQIVGSNPTAQDISSYLATKPGSDGFGPLIEHESHGLHFNVHHEPVRSFDNGYGICQLTSPTPTFEQCWSWKLNIDAGLVLFGQKRSAAIRYLSQSNRTYSAAQLRYETVARWNGGAYHSWDGKAWVRNPDILCDPSTGNIGWDTSLPENSGKTSDALHGRDKATYGRGHRAGDKWEYSGVCYADAILG